MTVKADLHTHTVYSDGSCSPAELLRRARKQGLTHLAITDHDTVEGLSELSELDNDEVKIVKGVELSCEAPRSHILGYGFDLHDKTLREKLSHYQSERARRMQDMVERINKKVEPNITLQAVQNQARGGLLAKPHLAKVLVNEGAVTTIREAFSRFLARGEILDRIGRDRFTAKEAISTIKRAGGLAALAHPIFYDRPFYLVQQFVRLGGTGLEVRYPDYSEQQEKDYRQLARAHDLAETGGTDFHGPPVKPETELGDYFVGSDEIEKLEERVQGSLYL